MTDHTPPPAAPDSDPDLEAEFDRFHGEVFDLSDHDASAAMDMLRAGRARFAARENWLDQLDHLANWVREDMLRQLHPDRQADLNAAPESAREELRPAVIDPALQDEFRAFIRAVDALTQTDPSAALGMLREGFGRFAHVDVWAEKMGDRANWAREDLFNALPEDEQKAVMDALDAACDELGLVTIMAGDHPPFDEDDDTDPT